jgi:DNA-binding transcriptional LysR family regulator
MEIRQIDVFLAVMEHSTVTLAAQKLHVSPGAVSLQLHNLARELRTQLFVRSGKRIVPTREAFRLAEHGSAVGRRLVRQQALAMPKTEYPRSLTSEIAEFLRGSLTTPRPAPLSGPKRSLQ